MGNGGISSQQAQGIREQSIELMMPTYYIHNANVTPLDIARIKEGWEMIVKDKAPGYLAAKKENNDPNFTSITHFYSLFYLRLFDVHPSCKPLFVRGVSSQGTFLVKMITLTINQLKNPKAFKKVMENLAIRHCQLGVKAVEYGIVGDVLFYCLRQSLGPEIYNDALDHAWKRVYSTMIQTIVPLTIEFEISGVMPKKEADGGVEEGEHGDMQCPIQGPGQCPIKHEGGGNEGWKTAARAEDYSPSAPES